MINQQTSQVQTNQYGFYAIPKAVQPKRKYRQRDQQYDQQYSEEQLEDDNKFQTIDRQPINQKQLERDYYVDQAPYPQFKPKQRGLDYGVQVQRGDLFDYQIQVKPLLQIIVGRSIVSAINQLQQQKQVTEKRQSLDKYQKKRNAQLMVTQRMEAKSKRKHQQSDRRKLQKQLYVKNKKQAQKKLLARKNAKQAMLGLKDQLFDQLDQQGFLRDTPVTNLQINYQGWLYQTVTTFLNQQKSIQNEINSMKNDKKKQLKNQHQKNIEKEKQRQKDILDQRERKKRQLQQRKRKKRIRKLKIQLREQRQPLFQKLNDNLDKHDRPKGKILSLSSQVSNGLTQNVNQQQRIYISGGLMNFVLALLNSSQDKYSAQEVQAIFQKVLKQSDGSIIINLSSNNIEKWQQTQKKIEEQAISFMKNKQSHVNQLLQSVSLDLSYLEKMGVSLKSDLHKNILRAALNVYLTCLPQEKDGQSYESTQNDKKRQLLKQKIEIKNEQSEISKAGQVESFLRVHFQLIKEKNEQQQEEKKEEQAEGQQKPTDLDEWINIYNGQEWERKLKNQQLTKCKREEQGIASYSLIGFSNSYVYDERNMHYLRQQLQGLLNVKGGNSLNEYIECISNIEGRLNKRQEKKDGVVVGIPVYDGQLIWGQ